VNTSASTNRGPGRPPRIDPESVAAIALELFERRGFDDVSMDEVASAAGVSRRSLFRLFPSKAALVWAGLTEADSRFTEAFDHDPDDDGSVLDHVRRAYVASLAPLSVTAEITRRRLIIIDEHPEIFAWGRPLLGRFEAHLIERVAASRGEPADSVGAVSVAAAISGAAFAALVWWARNGDDRPPGDVVDEALRGLRLLEVETAQPAQRRNHS
jgi:AcrR family transcriptional regulator